MLPRFIPTNTVQRIRCCDNHHVEFIHQDNQLPSMSPGQIQVMVTHLSGPPLVAIAYVALVTAHFVHEKGIFRVSLKGIMYPVSGENLLSVVFTIVEI